MVLVSYFYMYLFWLALPLLCGAALRWGGWQESIVAFLYLGAAAASILLQSSILGAYRTIEGGILMVDLLLLAGLILVTLGAGKWWLIWSVAIQAIPIAGHLARVMMPNLSRMTYAIMLGSSSYPALILLGIGILQSRRETNQKPVGRF